MGRCLLILHWPPGVGDLSSHQHGPPTSHWLRELSCVIATTGRAPGQRVRAERRPTETLTSIFHTETLIPISHGQSLSDSLKKKRELFNWLGGKTTRLAVALPIFPSCGTYCRSCFLSKMKLVTPDDAHKLSSRDLEYPNFTAYVAMAIPRARSDRWQYGSTNVICFKVHWRGV